MRLRFLTSPKIIRKYTMGECRSLATTMAVSTGGKVKAIGSANFKNYHLFNEEDSTFDIYNNPMHYICQLKNGEYCDIYGVYVSQYWSVKKLEILVLWSVKKKQEILRSKSIKKLGILVL